MCGHLCKCFCHKNGDMACVRCACTKCDICEDYISFESFDHHINLCHHMAQVQISRPMRRPPVADLVAVAA